MNLSIWLAFGAMLGWGVGDFFIQKTVKKIGAIETLFYLSFISSFLFLPFIIGRLPNLTSRNIIFLVALGLISFTSGYAFMRALKIGKLSVIETITALELPLTIIWGCLFFKETLNLIQIILIAVLFFGIILISVNFKNINKLDFLEKGSIFAFITAVVVSAVNFLSALGAKEIDPLVTLWLAWLVCGLVCGGFIVRQKNCQLWKTSLKNWRLILITILVDTFAWLAYVLAVRGSKLSITIAITESFVVVALLLGVIFNKEKITKIQFCGAALAITASLIISFIR